MKLTDALFALKELHQGRTHGLCANMHCFVIACENCPLNNFEPVARSKLFTALEAVVESRSNPGSNAPATGEGH